VGHGSHYFLDIMPIEGCIEALDCGDRRRRS
jgi:hypothetical protein